MKTTLRAAIAVLFLACAGIASAQTYTKAGPSTCLPTSHAAPTSPYDFACDSSGSILIQPWVPVPTGWHPGVQVEFSGSRVGVFVPTFEAWGEMTAVTNWVQPVCPATGSGACSTPGAIAFNWEVTDNGGVSHTGSFSATVASIVRDWRGWVHPQLTQIVFTVN